MKNPIEKVFVCVFKSWKEKIQLKKYHIEAYCSYVYKRNSVEHFFKYQIGDNTTKTDHRFYYLSAIFVLKFSYELRHSVMISVEYSNSLKNQMISEENRLEWNQNRLNQIQSSE